jgi:hypothetical protein
MHRLSPFFYVDVKVETRRKENDKQLTSIEIKFSEEQPGTTFVTTKL